MILRYGFKRIKIIKGSPVSAFAEDLDTPVHEDPIDEVQSNTSWIHKNCTVYRSGVPVTFSAHAYCDYSWTEGIGAQFNSVTITVTGVAFNGYSATCQSVGTTYLGSYGIWAQAQKTYTYHTEDVTFSFTVTVYCDEYGDLSINAS